MRKKIMLLAFLALGAVASSSHAEDPLYDTRLGHMAFNLGYFYGNTQITTNWDSQRLGYQSNVSGSSGSMEVSAYLGLGHDFAFRYHTSYCPDIPSLPDVNGKMYKVFGANYNEFTLQYRMIDDFYNLFGDVEHIDEATQNPKEQAIMKDRRDYVAFFVGYNYWSINTGNNTDVFSSPVIGIAVSVPMSKKLTQTNRLSLALTNNFIGELGFSYEIVDNWCATANFITFDSFAPRATYYKNGIEIGTSWQY